MKVEHLSKDFVIHSKKLMEPKKMLHALSDVSFEIYEGETLGIIGFGLAGGLTAWYYITYMIIVLHLTNVLSRHAQLATKKTKPLTLRPHSISPILRRSCPCPSKKSPCLASQ